MAVFEYKAIDKSGKTTRGVIDAESPSAARQKLRDQDLFPTDMQETAAAAAAMRNGDAEASTTNNMKTRLIFGRVSIRDTALMTRQLAVLLQAGMPLVEALSALLEMTSRTRLKKALYDVRDKVKSGNSLADALARHPRIFSALYSNMVRAGEASGTLEQVLKRLADIEEHQAKLRAKVMSALAYPAFMGVFALGVITFLMLVIVPKITLIFEKQKQDLPAITEFMIGGSRFIGHYWWLIAAVFIGLLALWRIWVSTDRGHLAWDRLKLKMPLFGELHLKMVSARFARTLGTMLESGLTMMRALDVVKSVIGNRVIEESMGDVKAGVRRGKDLARPLKEAGHFPAMMIHMVDLGQRSGEIENMLLRVADTYDDDVRMAVDAMVGLLEPLIIIVMGIFVGFLVLAILLPILNMSKKL